MKIKRKNTVKSLRNDVARQRLRLEKQLLEAQSSWVDELNFVDPREAYRDDATGEMWDEIGVGSADETVEPFRNETEHARIRRRCKIALQRNPYAENLVNNLVAFTVGLGHRYKVVAKSKKCTSEARVYINALQRYLDNLLRVNKWKQRQKEICRRMHRDGEAFIQIFPQEDGSVRWRFVEPGDVSTPTGLQREEYCSYGIKTDPEDVETVEAYFVNDEEIPYYDIQHRKKNVDANTKRGLSSLWCVLENLERARRLLRNMSIVVQTQSSIALIRKHDSSAAAVRSFVNKNASFSGKLTSGGEDRNFKRLRPGTIIDAKKGTDYEFPAVGLDPAAPVAVLGAELRSIASSKSLPEYMVGSDASNANYSSTMVAESPAVRYFESEQEEMIEADLELFKLAIMHAVDTGRLKPECLKYCKIEATAPKLVTRDPKSVAETDEIYSRMRVKSPQTIQGELGLETDQEFANWLEYDDAQYGEPVVGVAGGDQTAAIASTKEEAPEAALLSMAGGITGAIEIATAVATGMLTRESAIEMYKMFYRLDDEEATRLVGPKMKIRPVPTTAA